MWRTHLYIRQVIFVSMVEALHTAGFVTFVVVPHAHSPIYYGKESGRYSCNYHD